MPAALDDTVKRQPAVIRLLRLDRVLVAES